MDWSRWLFVFSARMDPLPGIYLRNCLGSSLNKTPRELCKCRKRYEEDANHWEKGDHLGARFDLMDTYTTIKHYIVRNGTLGHQNSIRQYVSQTTMWTEFWSCPEGQAGYICKLVYTLLPFHCPAHRHSLGINRFGSKYWGSVNWPSYEVFVSKRFSIICLF